MTHLRPSRRSWRAPSPSDLLPRRQRGVLDLGRLRVRARLKQRWSGGRLEQCELVDETSSGGGTSRERRDRHGLRQLRQRGRAAQHGRRRAAWERRGAGRARERRDRGAGRRDGHCARRCRARTSPRPTGQSVGRSCAPFGLARLESVELPSLRSPTPYPSLCRPGDAALPFCGLCWGLGCRRRRSLRR